jgi:uncharacterized protein (TIGR02757 family)
MSHVQGRGADHDVLKPLGNGGQGDHGESDHHADTEVTEKHNEFWFRSLRVSVVVIVASLTSPASLTTLRAELERHYHAFNREDAAADPIELVRPFADPADREIAGFCAAALAFGRVASVLNSIQALLRVLGPHPAAFARRFDPAHDGRAFDGLVHRWTRGRDLAALVWILRAMLERSGSVEAFFLEGFEPGHDDVGPALESFSRRARAIDLRPVYTEFPARSKSRVPKRPGVHYFFPCPSSGSGCKRLNLFVRWMVRQDQVDLGVWTRIPKAKLIVPLDTHVIRLGRCLRLTRYASPGWKMAAEITSSLRTLDPADPVKFDFSLCHLGMMSACGYGRPERDSQCPLRGLCRPSPSLRAPHVLAAASRRQASPAPSARR